jgi:uncharacterized protein YndB with AHSA1/START domain
MMMDQVREATKDGGSQPPPLRISRLLHAPRPTVWRAWTAADHVKRWFAPEQFTVPEAEVEPRPGGRFDVCMRAPDGTDHWSRGHFVEVVPDEQLVFEGAAVDADGRPLFRVRTEVRFSDALTGTQLDVVQTYEFVDPAKAAPMVAGAPVGWSQTLDKLEAEVVRMQGAGSAERSVSHGTFHLERTYDAPAERVWKALSDQAAKEKWFGGDAGQWQALERSMDFRVGGRERAKGRWEGGTVSTFDAIYYDIVPGERIVYSYEMHLNEQKISVSLATFQLKPDGRGTKLMITEQGAFLDGYDDAGSRERGTNFLLDRLGASLGD